MSGQAVEYIEIDIPYCALTYGVAPCQASLTSSPPTGTVKCFNTLSTCQDLANIDLQPVTLRFAKPAAYLPRDIDALPWIKSVDFTPAIISLGVDLGQRASLKVALTDHPHSDAGPGLDKYYDERAYDPYTLGTFFGRFRARQPYMRGVALRWITGFVGQALADMETRYFFVDRFQGPGPDGIYELIASDTIKLLDGDRSKAPVLSNGFLVAAITNVATSATLSPAGIGAAEYPASGWVCIGGKEVCAFTRSGDVLTLTRGQLGTTAIAHTEQDRVQLVLRYDAEDAADILYDLMTVYGAVPASYITLADWQAETAAYLNRVYTATIVEPTSVNALCSELIEQGALVIWDDNVAQKLRLQVLHGILTDAEQFSESDVLEGTITLSDQPEKRLSQVWVYFGQIDPTKSVTDLDNYRSSAIVIDAEAEANHGAAIKKIPSRWTPQFGRTIAERMATIQLGRYRTAPRRLGFSLLRDGDAVAPALGSGYRLEWWNIQDATGARASLPFQLTRLSARDGRYLLEAEEMLFTSTSAEDLDARSVSIDSNTTNINLRTIHDTLYPEIESGQSVTFTITAGVIVGSTSTALPAIDVGDWPAGVTVNLVVIGRIQGKGGQGGGSTTGIHGLPGGTALLVGFAINLDVDEGEIWGGAGGGGGYIGVSSYRAGGGGAGSQPGAAGVNTSSSHTAAEPGTTEAGGLGSQKIANPGARPQGGNGGDPGLPGDPADTDDGPGNGGAAGTAIDGISFVTVTAGPGDIRGAQIN